MMGPASILADNAAPRQRKAVDAVLRHANLNQIPLGGRLPSIRAIASTTGIAHATVAKAIKYLSDNGVVESRGRGGTVLLREIGTPGHAPQGIQRMVLLHCITDNRAPGLPAMQSDFELRYALKLALPGLEVASILHTPQEGREFVENLIHLYYTQMGRPKNVIFLLANSPRWVKMMFQSSGIPSIVLGGNEEGITLPNVTTNVKQAMDKVVQVIADANAYPAAFIADVDVLIGEQLELVRYFEEMSKGETGNGSAISVLRTSGMFDVFCAQLTEFLRGDARPRTLITRGDETAMRVARVCAQLGLHGQVKIISMEGSSLGERIVPSITGMYRDPNAGVQIILEMAESLCRDEVIEKPRREVEPIMIFRESFPNPYAVRSEVFTNGTW